MASWALVQAPCATLALTVTCVRGLGSLKGKPARLHYIGTVLRGQKPLAEEHHFSGHPMEVLAPAIRAVLHLGVRAINGADAVIPLLRDNSRSWT